jgi:cytochrome d ubiquinol oxidase subunit II
LSLDFIVAAVGLVALELYAIFGGADFGGGVWDLLASGPRRQEQRAQIARAMGPVWETNHVWLIFIIVLLFTCFPSAFAALSIGFYAPLTLVVVGIVFRGAAFAFRAHAYHASHTSNVWGSVFGIASTITPILYGCCAGALAMGSYEWTNPFAWTIGAFALSVCAQSAAVFLALESTEELRDDFSRRAIYATLTIAVCGLIAIGAAKVLQPQLYLSFFHPHALGAVVVAMLSGLVVLFSLIMRRYVFARVAVVIEILAILGGWYGTQEPYILPHHITLAQAAASDATLSAFLWIVLGGSILLIPSLVLLFVLFKGLNPATDDAET